MKDRSQSVPVNISKHHQQALLNQSQQSSSPTSSPAGSLANSQNNSPKVELKKEDSNMSIASSMQLTEDDLEEGIEKERERNETKQLCFKKEINSNKHK